MKINDFVDKIYCINLDRRPDRWGECEKIFNKHGLVVERFSAVDGKDIDKTHLLPGELGVIRSNYNVIKKAKENNLNSVMIFEDDVELSENFNELFSEYIKQVPDDWSFIYLGGNHVGGISMVTNNVFKMRHTFAIHAIIIKSDIYDHILNLLSEERTQVDVVYANLQKVFPSYVFRPHLAWQRKDFSDIQGGIMDYDFLRR